MEKDILIESIKAFLEKAETKAMIVNEHRELTFRHLGNTFDILNVFIIYFYIFIQYAKQIPGIGSEMNIKQCSFFLRCRKIKTKKGNA